MKKLENLKQLIKENKEGLNFTAPTVSPEMTKKFNQIQSAFNEENFGYNIIVSSSYVLNESAEQRVNCSLEINLIFQKDIVATLNTKDNYYEYQKNDGKTVYYTDNSSEYKSEVNFNENPSKYMEIVESELIEGFLKHQAVLLVQKEQNKAKANQRIQTMSDVIRPISYNTPKP